MADAMGRPKWDGIDCKHRRCSMERIEGFSSHPKELPTMRTVIHGFAGWARMSHSKNECLQVLDAAITVVGTLLVALAWAIVKN
jgi:hypothetical protein